METIETLKNKIWITRKARIRASERLAKSDSYSKLMLAYYSFAALAFSILELKARGLPPAFPLLDVLLGVLLFGAAIYVNTLNFSSRANALKRCYLTLDQLYLELDQLPSAEDSDSETQGKFESIRESYKSVLEESENHSEYDYFGVMLATYGRSKSNNLTRIQLMRYLGYQVMSLCLSGVVVVFPVAVGLWALKL